MSARNEHLRELAAAALDWGHVSADFFAAASDRLAALARRSVAHAGDAPEAAQLAEFADRLTEWAANARRDALDIGEVAGTLRDLADEADES